MQSLTPTASRYSTTNDQSSIQGDHHAIYLEGPSDRCTNPAADPAAAQTGFYTFTLVNLQIFNTRARHNDSLYKASLSVAVGNGAAQTVVKDLGDLNNGVHPINLSLGPLEVSDSNVGVAFNYLIVNSGHNDSGTVNQVLTKAGNALATAGAKAATSAIGSAVGASIGGVVMPVVGTILGAAAGWLVGEVTSLLDANCDGPVAVEQPTFKGVDLWNQTQSHPLTHTTFHPGIDSNNGCGSNSQYNVTWSIRRS